MKLRYETGIAAMIQFLVVTLLSFLVSLVDSISGCQDAGSTYDCVSGIGINLLYVILVAAWFGFLWVLAYAVQDRRDHRLARILMGAEAMVLVVALFNAKHFPNHNWLALLTSLVDAVLAAWVIWLAFRLSRAKGGRITGASTRSRPRRRPTVKVDNE